MTIAAFGLVALDCPNPMELAKFYQQIIGGTIDEKHIEYDWVELHTDSGVELGFQLAPNYRPPEWPDGVPQQMHLDFDVTDLDAGEEQVVAIGARKTAEQPSPEQWRVFLDPAGHPFCLVKA